LYNASGVSWLAVAQPNLRSKCWQRRRRVRLGSHSEAVYKCYPI